MRSKWLMPSSRWELLQRAQAMTAVLSTRTFSDASIFDGMTFQVTWSR